MFSETSLLEGSIFYDSQFYEVYYNTLFQISQTNDRKRQLFNDQKQSFYLVYEWENLYLEAKR